MRNTFSKGRALIIECLLERLANEKLVSTTELKRLKALKALEVEELFKF